MWNPLWKAIRHGSKSHLMQGDEIFLEKYVTKLEELENFSKKLHKDAKKYEDLILQVNEYEKKMTTDLSNSIMCQDEEILRSLVEEWHSFISEISAIDENLVLVTRRVVIEPLKRFQNVFSEVKTALKKREQALQECAKINQKVKKLQEKEKTGVNLVKLQAAKQHLATLEEELKNQDSILQEELPHLYEGRIEYFQPSLEALIKIQVEYSGDVIQVLNQALTKLNEFSSSEANINNIQNQRFSAIHALSIIADKEFPSHH